jgi:hypothetical protein
MLFFRDKKKVTGDTPVVKHFARHGNDTLVRCPACAKPMVIEGPDRRIFGKRFEHDCGRAFVVARDAQYDPHID